MKAIILAGGFGKRLKPLTDSNPKSLITILDKPIISWQIQWLRNYKIKDFIICAGYMKDNIINYLGDGSNLNINIEYSIEDRPLGTAGALKNCENLLDDEHEILVLNGDVITNINPINLIKEINNNILCSMAVVPLQSPFGIVNFTKNSIVTGFKEKPLISDYWINAGVYSLSKNLFSHIPKPGSLENDVFPKLANNKNLKVIKYDKNLWKSIDSHKDIEEANLKFTDFI